MLNADLFWIWVFTTTSVVHSLQVHPPPDSDSPLTSRMDRLENLVADHQVQFQRERHQWVKETEILSEKLHLLQGGVLALQQEKQEMTREMEALRNMQTLTQTLVAENQGLKAQLGAVQRQMSSVQRKQRSLQALLTKCVTKPRPGRVGSSERRTKDTQVAEGQSGRPVQVQGTSAQHVRGPIPSQHENASSPAQYMNNSDPVRYTNDVDPVPYTNNSKSVQRKRHPDPSYHVQAPRSDDQGPLEVVINHLVQQMTEVTADVQALKVSEAARGSTFTHWGSSSCGGSSELVYAGVVGGSWYQHPGAAVDALCLSLSPKLLDMPSGLTATAMLYGGEYQTYDSHMDMDPVCAVCRSLHPTTIMTPGTNVCPSEWTLQYRGFLMAGYYNQAAASQYLCVDTKMESEIGSHRDDNGYLLYYTQTNCGNLPCPPYENNKLVTCAVCSK